ncbi:CRISPR-associated protein CXXC_CXXC region [Syntrophobotulus glycolicus DSM 8271]|uniref:CRISPR-associated protein CXXC_CXXC region n=1 Tax=Syntrophobotulus glycolicus (strain DSM 8271 / FlGlyR) TaxID=645991 RepID=F0SWC3_SYNGF|nr:type I-B CRISPR-associated protein Cas8b1/Cst1 [Syntrophobotulus glycolicus]ADY55689.1 CRISPR-associated protein CXXC_CXXC region [Syntrophobotulus glycolicus DSM 8271]
MEEEILRLRLGDWQWNGAVIGFIRIVGRENVLFENESIKFSSKLLENFEEKYFAYFIKAYEKTLSWYKIVSFKEWLEAQEDDEFGTFVLKDLNALNEQIKTVKSLIKSNSYKAAYELMALGEDILVWEKELVSIKEPKSEQAFAADKPELIAKVRETFSTLRKIISYCESPEGKRYIRAKNIIYTVIKNAWNGVSFLNPQTKEKDVYLDYKAHFVDGAIAYLKQNKDKFKYHCFICDEPIKDMSLDLSFMNATGFDVARKSSHVWDFQNDIAVCPLCKLIYSCLPAGFTYVYDRGIYININTSVEDAYEVNYKIHHEVLRKEGNLRSIYPVLIGALHEQENAGASYELADIQVVRYEREAYRFNILSRKMLQLIFDSKDRLDSLINTSFAENKLTVRIYDEAISRIFNNQNLFTLIHRMLYDLLSDPSKCRFNGAHITHLLRINQRIYQTLGGMKMGCEDKDNALVREARTAGEQLKRYYYGKNAQHKLPGICYRLLNALKTSNQEMFLDVTLNCYLYVGFPVQRVHTDSLGQEKDFSTVGYAFVAALIDNSKSEDKGSSPVGEMEEEKK